ncbi:hypothetical protein BDR04DRAFT_1143856 [Suillus decipiens]|nr:hypothetical protein BDR04DRAFT_1143856 [Suillus decipiens]
MTFNARSTLHPHPATHGSSESHTCAARGHSTARSHHSQYGSTFHNSESESDHDHVFSYSSSLPPVPHVPATFGARTISGDRPSTEEGDKVSSGPKMLFDYVPHPVRIWCATLVKSNFIGPSLDPKFDDLMDSLGKIAQKDPQTVIRRWSRRHNDNVVTYGQHLSTAFILSEPLIFRRVCLELVTILAFGIGQSAVRQQLNCWEGFLSLVERRLKLYEHASTVVLGVSTILTAALWPGGHVQNARYFAVTVLISGSLICSGNVILIVKDIFIEVSHAFNWSTISYPCLRALASALCSTVSSLVHNIPCGTIAYAGIDLLHGQYHGYGLAG